MYKRLYIVISPLVRDEGAIRRPFLRYGIKDSGFIGDVGFVDIPGDKAKPARLEVNNRKISGLFYRVTDDKEKAELIATVVRANASPPPVSKDESSHAKEAPVYPWPYVPRGPKIANKWMWLSDNERWERED